MGPVQGYCDHTPEGSAASASGQVPLPDGLAHPIHGDTPDPEIGSNDESIQTTLVVEDKVLIRLPLAEYLRRCGYPVPGIRAGS
jgi:hypothetical protein